MKKILILDNYDSFTYNLVHIVKKQKDVSVNVYRNDAITPEEAAHYDAIILSPGPGIPDEAGHMKSIIKNHAHCKPILGICLGHQAIAEVFGARLYNMDNVLHGIQHEVQQTHKNAVLFQDIPKQFKAGRYHSWSVSKQLNQCPLEITCTDTEGEIMGIQHKDYPCFGLQFHPESILTPMGEQIIHNFLAFVTSYYHEKHTQKTI